MSAASDTAALPDRPDPPPDPAPAHAPAPTRIERLFGLLRKLVDYGRDLAHALQQPTAAATVAIVALHFGTRDVTLILARILRGLQLANALVTRLARRPVRDGADPALLRAPPDRVRRATRSEPRDGGAKSPLALMPTAEEIAAALRNRPVGAVIADICRDLGIVPTHPLWREVQMVVTDFGGNLPKLFKDALDRMGAWLTGPSAAEPDGCSAAWPQAAAACGTGPP